MALVPLNMAAEMPSTDWINPARGSHGIEMLSFQVRTQLWRRMLTLRRLRPLRRPRFVAMSSAIGIIQLGY